MNFILVPLGYLLDSIAMFINFLQAHPLYWQGFIGALTTSGAFDYFKHNLELQGKARIHVYLSAITVITVGLHAVIIGMTFVDPADMIRVLGSQVLAYIGMLTLVYNFITIRVTKFLIDAQNEAIAASTAAPTLATPTQTSKPVSQAEDAGVALF